jgi:hypothetical protein
MLTLVSANCVLLDNSVRLAPAGSKPGYFENIS